jgi:hypothetical protein
MTAPEMPSPGEPADPHDWGVRILVPVTEERILENIVEGGITLRPGEVVKVDGPVYCRRCGVGFAEGENTSCGVTPE